MHANDLGLFAQKLTLMLTAIPGGKPLSESALESWFKALREFGTRDVMNLLDDGVRRFARVPTCNLLWETLNEERTTRIERVAAIEAARARQRVVEVTAPDSPEAIAALTELARLMKRLRANGTRAGTAWAQTIMDRMIEGDSSLTPTTIDMARRALKWSEEDLAEAQRLVRGRARRAA